jgi:integrase/recombinase XerD
MATMRSIVAVAGLTDRFTLPSCPGFVAPGRRSTDSGSRSAPSKAGRATVGSRFSRGRSKTLAISSKGGPKLSLSEHVRIRVHSEIDATMEEKKRAETLRPAQIRHLLRVTEATNRHAARDALVLLLGLTCALRITEIARLLASDVLMLSGQLRKEVSLRAAITKGCRPRCVFITHDLSMVAPARYIQHRWANGLGTEFNRKRFSGLCPETALVLTHKGYGFELTTKRRRMVDGHVEDYLACDGLQAHVTRLYQAAGLRGCSSHTGRRTFATRLVPQNNDISVAQRLLGHAELDHTDPYLQRT